MAAFESTGTTFGGKQVLRPETFAPALRALGKPANSFTCPVGPEPSRGCLILEQRDLDALDLNSALNLKFNGTTISTGGTPKGALKSLTFYNLRIVNDPIRIESVGDNNAGSAYLVQVTDLRYLADKFTTINKAYNLRKPAPPSIANVNRYYSDSLNGGSLWTWATLFADIWTNHLQLLGTAPSLPYTPTGTPEDFRFVGESAWKALTQVLDEIGCAVAWNPTVSTSQFTIVQLGTTQISLSQWENSYASCVMHSIESQAVAVTRVPATIRVCFQKRSEASPNGWPLAAYTVDTATNVSGALDGTTLTLWDHMPALFNSAGTIVNSSALNDRAAEVVANWLAIHNIDRDRKVYSGIVADILPGSQVRAVEWSDVGRGWQTVVMKRPELLIEGEKHVQQQSVERLHSLEDEVIFELNDDLEPGDSVTGTFRRFDGSSWTNASETATFYDSLNKFHGAEGDHGIARWSMESQRWEIVSLDSGVAHTIKFKVTQSFNETNAAINATLEEYYSGGNPRGVSWPSAGPNQIRNPSLANGSFWFQGDVDAMGFAVYKHNDPITEGLIGSYTCFQMECAQAEEDMTAAEQAMVANSGGGLPFIPVVTFDGAAMPAMAAIPIGAGGLE